MAYLALLIMRGQLDKGKIRMELIGPVVGARFPAGSAPHCSSGNR